MGENKICQLLFKSIYCSIGIIGILLSVGFLTKDNSSNFYIYFTNLTNYICFIFMLFSFKNNYKDICSGKTTGYDDFYSRIKFYLLISIFVVFAVNNFLLESLLELSYWQSLKGVIMHFILPIMFVFDFILFYKRKCLKIYDPIFSIGLPVVYVVCILVRASVLSGQNDVKLYPYFFLDVGVLGYIGVFKWIGALILLFTIVGYLFYFLNNFDRKKITNLNIDYL